MVSAPRVVWPELLDELPQDSPAALNSRRDLRIINRLLGSKSWFIKVLRERIHSGERVLEIGAGSGEMGRALQGVAPDIAGLDRGRRSVNWPPAATWFESDVFAFKRWAFYPIVIGNLFFHHFDRAGLIQLGVKLNRHARMIVANEPLRRRRTVRLFALLCPVIQAHPVTQYDGRLSIAAGFRHDELPHLLGLEPDVWSWQVNETWTGSYRMVAERRL